MLRLETREGSLSSSLLTSLLQPPAQARHSMARATELMSLQSWLLLLPPGAVLRNEEHTLSKADKTVLSTQECYVFLTVTEPGSPGLPLTATPPGPGSWQAPSKHLFYVPRGFPSASRVMSTPTLEKRGALQTTHFYAEGIMSDEQEMLHDLLLAFGVSHGCQTAAPQLQGAPRNHSSQRDHLS